jgi:ketosteroid isomerase-like protein/mannose-6-phosphate isomerase-like protein (cupin superfamily)
MARPSAKPVVHIDDGRVIATEWQFAPGAETGWHIHGHDYVVVPLTDGDLLLEEPGGGTRDAELRRHAPYSRRAGVEHNVVNAGNTDLAFLEVEIVDRPLDAARLATLFRFMNAWNARDVDALMDCMAGDCAFHASGGPDAAGRRHVGASSVRAAYQAIFEMYPEAAWTESRHLVIGDRGLSEWRFVGRDRDGNRVEVDGCDLFAFDGELIRLKDSYRKVRSD